MLMIRVLKKKIIHKIIVHWKMEHTFRKLSPFSLFAPGGVKFKGNLSKHAVSEYTSFLLSSSISWSLECSQFNSWAACDAFLVKTQSGKPLCRTAYHNMLHVWRKSLKFCMSYEQQLENYNFFISFICWIGKLIWRQIQTVFQQHRDR